jgi:hypothetical protein
VECKCETIFSESSIDSEDFTLSKDERNEVIAGPVLIYDSKSM